MTILYGPRKINKRIGKVTFDLGVGKGVKGYITLYVSYFMETIVQQVTISKDLIPIDEGHMVHDYAHVEKYNHTKVSCVVERVA